MRAGRGRAAIPTKVIQWATGSMGRTSIRRIIDHPSLELAGVYVYSDAKANIDAGVLVRRPKTGILATGDRDVLLRLDAEMVIHMPRITLPYDGLVADVEALLRSGKNVISTAGFHWPPAQGGDYVERLRAAAVEGGATLVGVGVNPGTIVERITLAATAMSASIEHIEVKETVDASGMASAAFAFDLMGLNSDPETNDIRSGPLATLYSSLFKEVLHFAADALGTRLVSIEPDHRLTLAPAAIVIPAGTIEAGRVAATEWRWTALFADGVTFTLVILWTADPALHGEGRGHWEIRITGRPTITINLDISEDDPSVPPSRALTDATVAVAIKAIPAVIAAPPGLFAFGPAGLVRAA
jgi:2,4-diaminopentanoate dehydrogenase